MSKQQNKGNEQEDINQNLLTSKRRSIFTETSDNIENKIEENLNRIYSNEPEIDNTASNQREEEDMAMKVTMYQLNFQCRRAIKKSSRNICDQQSTK